MESPRELTEDEKKDFRELFNYTVGKNFLMRKFYQDKRYGFIYPLYILFLAVLTFKTYTNILHLICSIFLGLTCIQLNFGFAHMWAHAKMLYYRIWNIKIMPSVVDPVPIVIFYARYHHQHDKSNNWMPELSYHNYDGSYAVAVSHWNSFTLLTTNYPINGYIVKLFMFCMLYFYTAQTASFYLAYEIGAIFLPISHDWVHERKTAKQGTLLYYFLMTLEYIGIFATREVHKKHHDHSYPTGYQYFFSSGLYSERLDIWFNKFWNYIYFKCKENNYPMYHVLWYPMILVFIIGNVAPVYILINL